ncbi:hypothetical protein scyTo_0012558 [Scyliorhinus torazame]|uniref:Phospholipid/glycerol acyltransferase domain-containing protein n=1 Tax=Scyliorhinus torazame TaxID=75743 RepID=A0A401PAE5_SCYTO|nr:hypothetical protein [Scyliorhinus torazame]
MRSPAPRAEPAAAPTAPRAMISVRKPASSWPSGFRQLMFIPVISLSNCPDDQFWVTNNIGPGRGGRGMAMNRKEIQHGSWILMKGTIRFLFMVINNLVAIPSYVLYLIVLQPLKLLNSKLFWHVEGIMFKWLLAMVSSWGWTAGYTVVEWGDDVKAITEDETMVLVNHQATGDVCTLMMCLQDKGTVVCHMMWLMEYVFKFTNFGVVSLIHGDFFIRQGKAHRDQQLILLRQHLEKYYRSRDRKWIVLFPEGGFLRKRQETSQSFAKKNNLPFLKHVTLPRQGATEVILQTLCAQHENGAVGDANGAVEKQKGLQWVIDITIAYHKAKPIDIQTWIIGYREPTITHVHYRILLISLTGIVVNGQRQC